MHLAQTGTRYVQQIKHIFLQSPYSSARVSQSVSHPHRHLFLRAVPLSLVPPYRVCGSIINAYMRARAFIRSHHAGFPNNVESIRGMLCVWRAVLSLPAVVARF